MFCFVLEKPKPKSRCNGIADVGFIIDSSGSLKSHYSKEKQFVKKLIGHFQISPSGVHAGLVLFSGKALLKIKFSDYNNTMDFNKAVDALPLMNSVTRIDLALKVAYDQMFKKANGMRSDVPRILILLTDGKQTPGRGVIPLPKAVAPFHKDGVKVIVIGIGSGVNRPELRKIAKFPKNVKLAKSFAQLRSASFVKKITAETCKSTGKSRNDFYCVINFFFATFHNDSPVWHDNIVC